MTALETTPKASEINLLKCLKKKKKKSFCSFPLGKMSAMQSEPGLPGGTVLQGGTMPRCWTQQGPIYLAELGCPPPGPDSHQP